MALRSGALALFVMKGASALFLDVAGCRLATIGHHCRRLPVIPWRRMPFTISHAAAALPIHSLTRSRLPLAALMVGSMAPDFAYFLPGGFGRVDTHSAVGVFQFSLPIGLLVWLYFVALLERPTLAFLPEAWRLRLKPTPLNLRTLLLAAIGVVAGAFSHLVWDAFTHSSTPVVEAIPALRTMLFQAEGVPVRVYFVLQVLSSAVGLTILLAWANGIRKRPLLPRDEVVPALAPAVSAFERLLALAFMAASSAAMGFFYVTLDDGLAGNSTLFLLLIGGMTGVALSWSLLAVALRFRSRGARWFAETNAE
jgi:Domain of unknown function (DUF4184)